MENNRNLPPAADHRQSEFGRTFGVLGSHLGILKFPDGYYSTAGCVLNKRASSG
jgi:hypothetical protein